MDVIVTASVSLVFGFMFTSIALATDVKNSLRSIDSSIKIKKNQSHVWKKMCETIKLHSDSIQLSGYYFLKRKMYAKCAIFLEL